MKDLIGSMFLSSIVGDARNLGATDSEGRLLPEVSNPYRVWVRTTSDDSVWFESDYPNADPLEGRSN